MISAIIAVFIVITVALRNSHKLHIHHYTAGIVFLVLTWFPDFWVAFNAGFSYGMIIEGAARWGYDPTWIPIKRRKRGDEADGPPEAKKKA